MHDLDNGDFMSKIDSRITKKQKILDYLKKTINNRNFDVIELTLEAICYECD